MLRSNENRQSMALAGPCLAGELALPGPCRDRAAARPAHAPSLPLRTRQGPPRQAGAGLPGKQGMVSHTGASGEVANPKSHTGGCDDSMSLSRHTITYGKPTLHMRLTCVGIHGGTLTGAPWWPLGLLYGFFASGGGSKRVLLALRWLACRGLVVIAGVWECVGRGHPRRVGVGAGGLQGRFEYRTAGCWWADCGLI